MKNGNDNPPSSTENQQQKYSVLQQLRAKYACLIKNIVNFLRRQGCPMAAMILGTILVESAMAIQAGFTYPLGWKRQFNDHHNPSILTQNQMTQRPILLLHGNCHNQSAWLQIAKKLKLANLGPFYTVNLHHGLVSEKDCKIVENKILEIKEQYKKWGRELLQIDLIGHSRGASLASWMRLPKEIWGINKGGTYFLKNNQINFRDDIGIVIRIGNAMSATEMAALGVPENVYEVIGEFDIILPEKSLLSPQRQMTVDCGHLELLYSEIVHNKIIQWLLDARSIL